MAKSKEAELADYLRRQGFDKSHVETDEDGDKSVRLGCSQCQALAINGHATHEMGCPNRK